MKHRGTVSSCRTSNDNGPGQSLSGAEFLFEKKMASEIRQLTLHQGCLAALTELNFTYFLASRILGADVRLSDDIQAYTFLDIQLA